MIRKAVATSKEFYTKHKEDGKIGYALLWLLGVPLPLLLLFYFIKEA